METLQIEKANAIKAYEEATDKTKKVLINLFGKQTFIKDIKQLVKSYADACEVLGEEQLSLSDFDALPEADRKHAFASHKLTIIARALNQGWVPDYSNGNEAKYYPWFKWVGSGVGFSFVSYVCAYSHSDVGARLSFKSRELAEYAGKQFIDEYRDYLSM